MFCVDNQTIHFKCIIRVGYSFYAYSEKQTRFSARKRGSLPGTRGVAFNILLGTNTTIRTHGTSRARVAFNKSFSDRFSGSFFHAQVDTVGNPVQHTFAPDSTRRDSTSNNERWNTDGSTGIKLASACAFPAVFRALDFRFARRDFHTPCPSDRARRVGNIASRSSSRLVSSSASHVPPCERRPCSRRTRTTGEDRLVSPAHDVTYTRDTISSYR